MSFKFSFGVLQVAGGSLLGFGILILIGIWSLVFDIPMIKILALYLDFEGTKNIHVLKVLIWGFGGRWRFLTGAWHVSYVRYINKVRITMDMIAAIEVQTITNFLPHQKRKFKSRTSEYFFKDMMHTQFKRTFRFSMEGVRYCQSEGQAELDFYSVLRAPAQHQPSRALSRKVSKIF